MSSSCGNRLTTLILACAMIVGAVHSQRAEAGAGLSFCVDSHSPIADSSTRIGRAVAEIQGFEAVIKTFNGSGHGDDPFPMGQFAKMATGRTPLVNGRCDLIMGFPVDHGHPSIPSGVKATPAYIHTGFVLVTPDPPPKTLDDFHKDTSVSVVWSTIPNLYILAHRNLTSRVFRQTRGALDAMASGVVDAAMVWQPSLVAYAKDHADARQWHVRLMDEPNSAWDLVALYAPQSQDVARIFEHGLDKLANQGKLQDILGQYEGVKGMKAVDDSSASISQVGTKAAGASNASAAHADGKDSAAGRDDSSTPKAPDASDQRPASADAAPSTSDAPSTSTAPSTADAPSTSIAPGTAGGKNSAGKARFTSKQVTQGQIVYAKHCARCHGGQLKGTGGPGPTLKGPGFASKDMGFTVGAIFGFMARQMPTDMPGGLSHEQYAQVMAFILKKNGYKPGDQPLTYEQAQRSEAPLVSKRK